MTGIIFFTLTMFLVLSSGMIAIYGSSVPSIASQLQGPINCDINNYPSGTCSFPPYAPPTPSNITVVVSAVNSWPTCVYVGFATLNPLQCSSAVSGTITNVGQSIWNGLVQVAYIGFYFSEFAFVFFNKLLQGIFLVYGITQLMSSDFSIPFLQYIWLAFLIFYIMYGLSMLKPGGSGLS